MTSQEMKKNLWEADKLRAQMEAAEYKHLELGLIFLKYVSDAFDERRREVAVMLADPSSELNFTGDPAEQAASIYDFATKKNVYLKGKGAASPFVRTREVRSEDSWTPSILTDRQERLVGVLKMHWDLDLASDNKTADAAVNQVQAQ
jgi:hypothetical protein